MRNWTLNLRVLFIFFQSFLIIFTKSQESNEVIIDGDKSSKPSIALQSPISQSQPPILEHKDLSRKDYGSEQVKKAINYLEKYNRHSPQTPRKHSGVFGTAGQYLQAFLPRLYIHGLPSDGLQDNQKLPGQLGDAVRLLEEAAQQDNPDAIYILAEMNFYGNFSHPKNYRQAFTRYYQLASLNGNSSAQHMLGFMYSTGIGGAVERDQAKALLYHTFAALNDNVRSEMTLAYRYHTGIGVAANCDIAVQHYKKVADKAIKWIRSGPPGGMVWVSDSYRLADENGGVYGEGASFSSSGNNRNKNGVHSDAHAALDDVLEYLDLMSRKGDFKATFGLGRIHYDGQKGLPRDLKSAKWYFMKVAKLYWQRDGRIIESEKPGLEKVATKAAGYLGRMFLRGEGVEQSFDKAQIWFQRGIKSADAGSQWGMGLMLLEGLGMPKNTVRATEYFKAAADQDFAPAQVSLGALYLDQGTPGDILVATRYFELAERYGNLEAYYFLAELINQGIGRDRNCGLASMYYKNVAEKVEPLLSSFTEANQAYISGDYELALIDYMHAAEQGWEKGQANVAYLLDDQKSLLNLPKWLSFSRPRPKLLEDGALALLYWTRSSKQSNIDSLVKMGDYYFKGIGTPADMEKAASCYTAACEYKKSAMALFNLAWMHENGAGLDQDFHLAKRYYDLALETNDEAYLPVTVSLLKLRIRSAWNTITNGRVNSIQDEPTINKQWSPSEWISNFLREENRYMRDGELEENFLPESNPMPVGNTDGLYDDNNEDGILESLIILGLCASLVFLIWYRQQRLQRQQLQRREIAEVQNGGVAAPDQRGLFPQ
ncbi:hypothetical protein HI914_00297 [Erysiphe necator]|uniref:Putative ubiquitin-protein ligase sel1 ubx2 n=1 Tax=Uncinula necator TaxID=52586 RepID=A0A0B1P310_UNCNE|nr:hypothetical protein HI914_00297 [Erysiphe necator]KHJ32668.1 putative ubiquitin-protein ligase sel1 ubx2 [Erysiphe necator]